MSGKRGLTLLQRFNNKYKIVDSGCWEWQNALNTKGYGQLWTSEKKLELAHRISYRLFIGNPDGLMVCHKCDNPKCVNPFHLFLGTGFDNFMDCQNKGRTQNALFCPSATMYRKYGCRCELCVPFMKEIHKRTVAVRNKRIMELKI